MTDQNGKELHQRRPADRLHLRQFILRLDISRRSRLPINRRLSWGDVNGMNIIGKADHMGVPEGITVNIVKLLYYIHSIGGDVVLQQHRNTLNPILIANQGIQNSTKPLQDALPVRNSKSNTKSRLSVLSRKSIIIAIIIHSDQLLPHRPPFINDIFL